MFAEKFNLGTWNTGYGETVIRPDPTEGRVTLRVELKGYLFRLRARAGR